MSTGKETWRNFGVKRASSIDLYEEIICEAYFPLYTNIIWGHCSFCFSFYILMIMPMHMNINWSNPEHSWRPHKLKYLENFSFCYEYEFWGCKYDTNGRGWVAGISSNSHMEPHLQLHQLHVSQMRRSTWDSTPSTAMQGWWWVCYWGNIEVFLRELGHYIFHTCSIFFWIN